MFTKQELYALIAFLKRTQVNGEEAPTLVALLQKIASQIKEPEKVEKNK